MIEGLWTLLTMTGCVTCFLLGHRSGYRRRAKKNAGRETQPLAIFGCNFCGFKGNVTFEEIARHRSLCTRLGTGRHKQN